MAVEQYTHYDTQRRKSFFFTFCTMIYVYNMLVVSMVTSGEICSTEEQAQQKISLILPQKQPLASPIEDIDLCSS